MKSAFFALLFLPVYLFAQKTHTVGPKETLFSLGRLYQVHPKELASFNNLAFDAGLTVGQVLKIPPKPGMTPLPPEVKSVPLEEKPVYHTVAKKQTLYAISKQYSVSIDQIKKWNALTTESVQEGASLIVGYHAQAVTAKMPDTPKTNVTTAPPPPPPPVEKKKEIQPEIPGKSLSVITNTAATNLKESFFKTEYKSADDSQDQKGLALVFKSTSGWKDQKYYCLYNKAKPGTILKIKKQGIPDSIYAKVLDMIPDSPQTSGAILLISDAGAKALGIDEENFSCEISF